MYSIIIAGSTNRTVQCAQALLADSRFQVVGVLTPEPKSIGRQQTLTNNPLHQWALDHNFPVVLIKNKIDETVKHQIDQFDQPDFLLVVDFGYFIPNWLLSWPKIAPLNIHPSALPRWRGSSPGQFVLLFGDTNSAVTLMIMNHQLDQGPILHQISFAVQPAWTQTEYYQHSFELICQRFPQVMIRLAEKQLAGKVQPQLSPTMTAGKLTKADAFVDWLTLNQAMGYNSLSKPDQSAPTSQLLSLVFQHTHSWPITLERATRAFSPWPQLWTLAPTIHGMKRLKIIKSHLYQQQLVLDAVQLEGLNITTWKEIANQFI